MEHEVVAYLDCAIYHVWLISEAAIAGLFQYEARRTISSHLRISPDGTIQVKYTNRSRVTLR
jgi:hypothetical protein